MNIEIRDKATGAKVITVPINRSATVSHLKSIISLERKFPIESFELFYDDYELSNLKRLSECKFPSDNITVDLVLNTVNDTKSAPLVNTPSNKTINIKDSSTHQHVITLKIDELTTVSHIKAIISNETSVPVEDQCLYYGNRNCSDSERLFYCNFPNGKTTFDLVVYQTDQNMMNKYREYLRQNDRVKSATMADLDRQQEPSQLKRINSKPKTSGLAEEKEQSKQSDETDSTSNENIEKDLEMKRENDALKKELAKLKQESEKELSNTKMDETDVTALKQKFEDERKYYELNQRKLESQAARLSSKVDEEIERSVQLHKEKTLLQKKLTNLAIRIQVNDLIDVLKETAYIQLQWKEMGTVLGIPQSVMDKIATEHSALSITRCHYEVMRYWIVEIGASWEALVSALQSSDIEQKPLAEEIENNYIKSHKVRRSQNHFLVLKDDGKVSSGHDIDKYDMFPNVDWKVLGLLLGLSDHILQGIEKSYSSDVCQQSMIDQWIRAGQAYWYTLVDALDGPVLGMTDIAEKIANEKLNQPAQEARAASNQVVVPCPYTINEEEVELQKKKILAQLGEHKGTLKGVVFLFAMTDPKGVYKDMENVRETFRDSLKFAVFRVENPDGEYIATFVKAAATLNFADDYPKCVTKAFYFAGHGGIDELKRPFFVPQQIGGNQKEVILIRETILSHFQKVRPDQSFLFFFDCCLVSVSKPKSDGNSNDEENQTRIVEDVAKEFKLEPPFRCVIAYGTSVGSTSIGDTQVGGWFTSSLCKNIKEKIELGEVLSKTNEDVAKISNNQQLPQYRSCVGPIYLKGKPEKPIKTTENESSSNVFKRYREELFELLSKNQLSVTSLATRINMSSSWMIDDEQLNILCNVHDKETAASTLLNCLEKGFDENPEALTLQDTFNHMEKISILVGTVQRMRESMKMSKTTINTNMAKVLKESKEREEKFRNENIDLKNKLKEFEETKDSKEARGLTEAIEVTDSGEVVKEFKLTQTKLENENADVQSKLRKLQEEYSKMEAQVKDSVREASKQSEAKVTKIVEEFNEKEIKLENDKADLKSKLEQLKETSEETEAKVTKIVTEFKEKEARLEKDNSDLKSKIENLQDYSKIESRAAKDRDASVLKEMKFVNENADLKSDLNELQEEVSRLKRHARDQQPLFPFKTLSKILIIAIIVCSLLNYIMFINFF